MKKQTTKRALAGVLAVLTVAGSAPANVGGLIFAANNAIVASAADETTFTLSFGGASASTAKLFNFIQSVKFGDTTVSNIKETQALQYPITNYSTVEVKATVPMTFGYSGEGISVAAKNIKAGGDGDKIYDFDGTKKAFYTTVDPVKFSPKGTGLLSSTDQTKFFVSDESNGTAATLSGVTIPSGDGIYELSDGQLTAYTDAKENDKVYVTVSGAAYECKVREKANYATYTYTTDNTPANQGPVYSLANEDEVKTAAVKQLLDDEDVTQDQLGDLVNAATIEADGTVSLGLVNLTESVSNGVWTYSFTAANKQITMNAVKTNVNIWNGYTADATTLFGPTDAKIKSTDDKEDTAVTDLKVKSVIKGESDFTGAIGSHALPGTLATDNAYVNEEITLTSSKYFEAWAWDTKGTTNVVHKFASLAKDGKTYEIKLNALSTTTKTGDVVTYNETQILVQKAAPAYTYALTENDTVLKTQSPVVATAASISGKGYAYDSATGKPSSTSSALATSAEAMANGSKVAVELKRSSDYTTDDRGRLATIKITRDGKELADNTPVVVKKTTGSGSSATVTALTDVTYGLLKALDEKPAAVDSIANSTDAEEPDGLILEFTGAGKYAVSYTTYVSEKRENVATASVQDKTMTYKFEIAKRDEPTAKNVTLSAAGTCQNDTWKTKLKTTGTGSSATVKDAKLVNGVFVFELKQGQTLGGKTFTVDPSLFTDLAKKNAFAHKNKAEICDSDGKEIASVADKYDDNGNRAGDTYWVVSGSTSVSSVNKKQKITLTYSDPEITAGEQTLEIYWMISEAETTVQVVDADAEAFMLSEVDKNFDFDNVDWDAMDVEDHSFTKINDVIGDNPTYPWKPGDYSVKTTTETSQGGSTTKKEYTYNGIVTSLDEIDDLEQRLMDSFVVVNGSKDDITFEYVKGAGVQLKNDEMDTHFEGVPTEVGDYSVYVLYKGKAANVIDVHISEHSLYAAPTEAQLNHTFGTALFDEKNLAYENSNGNQVKKITVKDLNYTVDPLYPVSKAGQKYINEETDKLEDVLDVYYIDDVAYTTLCGWSNTTDTNGICYASPSEDQRFLGAGHWLVTVQQDTNTTISEDGYSFSASKFVVNVDQKEIRKDMILIDPARYTGKKVTLTSDMIHAKDTDLPTDIVASNPNSKPANASSSSSGDQRVIGMKVADGIETGKDINDKGYAITVAPDDNVKNYTSTVDTAWYIVLPVANNSQNLSEFTWIDDETTIYNANGAIYVKAQRPADTSFEGEIVDYGIMWEAQGKLDMPVFLNDKTIENTAGGDIKPIATRAAIYKAQKAMGQKYAWNKRSQDAAVDAAYTALQYGNGTIRSKSQSDTASDKRLVSATIYVKDAQTGVWVRPYCIEKDKKTGELTAHCGEVRYVNIVDEATLCLNLATAPVATDGADKTVDVKQAAVTRKTVYDKATASEKSNKSWRSKVRAGYNEKTGAFNVYSYFNLKTTQASKLTADNVQRFGYAVDATGAFKDQADAAKRLKFDAGFTQGFSDKKNTVMGPDEVGASIYAKSSVATVYARTGVDFGNGIVVYTDPVAIKSVSEQFATAQPQLAFADITSKTGKYGMFAGATAPTKFDAEATLVRTGVVADFSGSFLKSDKQTGKYTFIDEPQINEKLTVENAKKYNYLVGKEDFKDEQSGSCDAYKTPSTDNRLLQIPAVVRAFSIYNINGNEIAVYGAPYIYRYDAPYCGNATTSNAWVAGKEIDLGDLGILSPSATDPKKRVTYYDGVQIPATKAELDTLNTLFSQS